VEAFHALQAKTLIPMHYGTFDLSDEPASEPARLLMQMAQQEKIKGDLCLPNLAEPLKIV
jgi:L-ascorbate metabolism protein UlaG (beta-lactamase superfamily)